MFCLFNSRNLSTIWLSPVAVPQGAQDVLEQALPLDYIFVQFGGLLRTTVLTFVALLLGRAHNLRGEVFPPKRQIWMSPSEKCTGFQVERAMHNEKDVMCARSGSGRESQ